MNILLVDEDAESLSAMKSALAVRADFQVLTATSAAEGFQAADALDDLDALVTAALMAPQDGFQLREGLRSRFPELRVAFVSKTDLSRHFEKLSGDIVFYKPVDTEALLDWLDRKKVGVLAEARLAGASVPLPAAGSSPDRGRGRDPLGATPAAGADPPGVAAAAAAAASAEIAELPPGPEFGSREGTLVGDYRLERLLHITERTESYEATQLSVQRRVAFTLLRDDLRRDDPEAVESFLRDVRAKASVVHQHIAPVYEAHQEEDALFYTRELIDGDNLADLRQRQTKLDSKVLIGLIQVVAESCEYLHQRKIPFEELGARHIYLGAERQARLSNIAIASGKIDGSPETAQIRRFAEIIREFADLEGNDSETEVLSRLLFLMGHEKDREINGSWNALKNAATAGTRELDKEEAYQLPDMEQKVKQARNRRKFSRILAIGAIILALAMAAWGVDLAVSYFARPEIRSFEDMIRIPAGKFQYQDGTDDVELEAFWIDEYEVTIAQYAEFLEALEENPTDEFDHPDQPDEKEGHTPPRWKDYYKAALRGGTFEGHSVDPNCPITLVDWWDAYAYANWKGRRLPTEEEWEKAARGRTGSIYPWGDEFDATKLNSSEDYSADNLDPRGGAIDGYRFWCPVDAIDGDVSAYDAKGMAGNVSEWTASWAPHPEFPDRLVPVKRGGSFAKGGFELSHQWPAASAEERLATVGFRTASSIRPGESIEE